MLLWTMEWEYVEPNMYPVPTLLEEMMTNSFGNKKFQAANERTQNTLKGAHFSPFLV